MRHRTTFMGLTSTGLSTGKVNYKHAPLSRVRDMAHNGSERRWSSKRSVKNAVSSEDGVEMTTLEPGGKPCTLKMGHANIRGGVQDGRFQPAMALRLKTVLPECIRQDKYEIIYVILSNHLHINLIVIFTLRMIPQPHPRLSPPPATRSILRCLQLYPTPFRLNPLSTCIGHSRRAASPILLHNLVEASTCTVSTPNLFLQDRVHSRDSASSWLWL